jgi:hypothetical protein
MLITLDKKNSYRAQRDERRAMSDLFTAKPVTRRPSHDR